MALVLTHIRMIRKIVGISIESNQTIVQLRVNSTIENGNDTRQNKTDEMHTGTNQLS
jgi:hypothetical protein